MRRICVSLDEESSNIIFEFEEDGKTLMTNVAMVDPGAILNRVSFEIEGEELGWMLGRNVVLPTPTVKAQ